MYERHDLISDEYLMTGSPWITLHIKKNIGTTLFNKEIFLKEEIFFTPQEN